MRFQSLDSWRGIAALSVALFHLEAVDHFSQVAFVRHSFLFVDFFFVLSGFVIAHAYGESIRSARDAGQFVVRRFGRIWPLHIAVLAAFVAIVFAKHTASSVLGVAVTTPAFDPDGSTPLATLPLQIFLLQSLDIAPGLTWNTPSWSISAEFWTYILFAAIILLLPRHRHVAFTASALIGAAALIAFSTHGIDVTHDLGLPRCIYGFSVGCLVYWARSRIGPNPPTFLSALEIPAAVAVIIFVSLVGRSAASYGAPLLFAAVVYIFSFDAGVVSRFLRLSAFQSLGRWSYSIYMIHGLIAFCIGLAVSELQRRLGISLWTTITEDGVTSRALVSDRIFLIDALHIAYAASVVGIAALTYRFIEVPGRNYFRDWADRMGEPDLAAPIPTDAGRSASAQPRAGGVENA